MDEFILQAPGFNPIVRKGNGKTEVFCQVRRKWLLYTPEEMTRQYFTHYLVSRCGYSASLMSFEQWTNDRVKYGRSDIVAYDRELKPLLLVECKSDKFSLKQAIFEQLKPYNVQIQAPMVAITNGLFYALRSYDRQTGEYQMVGEGLAGEAFYQPR